MIAIRVPGTTANLGPGFDCMGLALNVYGVFHFEELDEGLRFDNIAPEFQNEENLAVRAYRRTLREIGAPQRGLYLRIHSDIPVSSGLGSSASLLVAGAVAANEIHGRPLDERALLNLVTEMEGHPDNVAPALLGGLTASMMGEGGAISMRCPISPKVHVCALIPNFGLSTREARAALPAQVPLKDAVFNISRAAVLIKALEAGDFAAIAAATDDRLHQPYRAPLIRGYEKLRARALACGAAAFCVSGAGPTLLCLYGEGDFPAKMRAAAAEMEDRWRVLTMDVDTTGATVLKEDGR